MEMIALPLFLFLLFSPSLSDSYDPPNIILLVADDLGYGDLSSFGHPSQEWGVIDSLAREGMRFTHMYSAATFCTPSRTALLTGKTGTD
jgi:arylsulfatase A-like enzyme